MLDELNRQQWQLLGEVARGFLEDGLLDTLENLPKALLEMTEPVQLYRLVQLLRQAAANPQGFWMGLKEIEWERLQAVLAKLKELTTTPRGAGELLFDVVSIWLGGEALAAFKESELGIKLAAGLKGKPVPKTFTRSLETREPIPTSVSDRVPETPTQPTEPIPDSGKSPRSLTGIPDYSKIPNPEDVVVRGEFTTEQKTEALRINRETHGGDVRSDGDGRILTKPKESQKGVTPDPKEWQFDHKVPKSKEPLI